MRHSQVREEKCKYTNGNATCFRGWGSRDGKYGHDTNSRTIQQSVRREWEGRASKCLNAREPCSNITHGTSNISYYALRRATRAGRDEDVLQCLQ